MKSIICWIYKLFKGGRIVIKIIFNLNDDKMRVIERMKKHQVIDPISKEVMCEVEVFEYFTKNGWKSREDIEESQTHEDLKTFQRSDAQYQCEKLRKRQKTKEIADTYRVVYY